MTKSVKNPFNELIKSYSETNNTDVLYFNGPIFGDLKNLERLQNSFSKENMLLILTTNGGDPEFAFRLSRLIQNNYKSFKILIPGICKSAGTLITLGADELIMGNFGELGPLDLQMIRKDEVFVRESSLTVLSALDALQQKAFNCYEQSALDIVRRSGGSITFKTASDIAVKLAGHLYSPIYQQIEANQIGEVGRANTVAFEYAQRLTSFSNNLDEESIKSLVYEYPSHGFVIDYHEAKKLFKNIRQPGQDELKILKGLNNDYLSPNDEKVHLIFLSNCLADENIDEEIEEIDKLHESTESLSKLVKKSSRARK